MPWKLILILLIFGLFIAFTGFNLENTSVISFGFVVLEKVPIFLSLSIAFLAGAIFTLPFNLFRAKTRKDAINSRSKSLLGKAEKRNSRRSQEKGITGLTEEGNQYYGDDQDPQNPS